MPEFVEVEANDVFSIHEDPSTGIPLFRWEEYVTGETFRTSARDWEDYIRREGCQKYIVDTQEVPAHEDSDKEWLAETWVPELIEMGVRRSAGVYRDSAIAKMDVGRIEESLSGIHPDYEFRTFETQAEAYDWLVSQKI